jgi:CBS domain-containing protein
MTKNVIYFAPDETIAAASTMMKHFNIRHLPIVRDGELKGIISDRDILRETQQYKELNYIPEKRLIEIMNTQVLTCSHRNSISQAAELMLTATIDCLPVVDDENQLVGIITSSDILRLVANSENYVEKPIPFQWKLISSEDSRGQMAMN